MAEKSTVVGIVIIIITIIILFAFFFYAYVASIRNLYPFTAYTMVAPSNSVVFGQNVTALTDAQISVNQTNALNACNFLAESQNFMTMYCGKQPTNKIDCSLLQ